jgi:hypothetical protein
MSVKRTVGRTRSGSACHCFSATTLERRSSSSASRRESVRDYPRSAWPRAQASFQSRRAGTPSRSSWLANPAATSSPWGVRPTTPPPHAHAGSPLHCWTPGAWRTPHVNTPPRSRRSAWPCSLRLGSRSPRRREPPTAVARRAAVRVAYHSASASASKLRPEPGRAGPRRSRGTPAAPDRTLPPEPRLAVAATARCAGSGFGCARDVCASRGALFNRRFRRSC